MEQLVSVMYNIAILMAVVFGSAATIAIGYAGFLYMTASGDPQKMGTAKNALMGAFVGMVIIGVGFIIPGVISRVVLEPAGGASLTSSQVLGCDDVLRNSLAFQRQAGTSDRMNQVVARIQGTRAECSPDLWSPFAEDLPDATDPSKCWPKASTAAAGVTDTEGANGVVGATVVPASLRAGNKLGGKVRATSGRDSANNIIVYWKKGELPSDGSKCWLFSTNFNAWDEGY